MATIANLVHESSAGTGTGNLTISAVNGRQRFSDAFAIGGSDVFYYFISNNGVASEWEVGTGHLSDADTLVRDTVLKSSNSDALVSFSSGTKDVACDIPAATQTAVVLDAGVISFAALATAADKLPYTTGADVWAEATITAAGRAILDDATAAAQRVTLGVEIGVNVQAYDADLDIWAGLTPSANAQSLVTAANYAAMRTLLDLEAGTDFYSIVAANAAFQAADADLDTWAGLTPSANAQSLVTAANYAAMRTLLDLEAGTDFVALSGGTFSGDISVPDEVYGVGWNGSLEVPTKNAVYDKINTPLTEQADATWEAGTGTTPSIVAPDAIAAAIAALAGGGAWTFVSSTTLSSDATAEFTGLSTDFVYRFVFSNVLPATDAAVLWMRTSTDAGVSYDSGAADYRSVSTTAAQMVLTYSIGNVANSEGVLGGYLDLFNPSAASYTSATSVLLCGRDSGTTINLASFDNTRLSAADVDAVQFLFSSGNLASGTIKLYKLAAS